MKCYIKKIINLYKSEIIRLWFDSYKMAIIKSGISIKNFYYTVFILMFILSFIGFVNIVITILSILSTLLTPIIGVSNSIYILNLILKINLYLYTKIGYNSTTNDINKDGWDLVFNDEFDDDQLDSNKWFNSYTDRPCQFIGGDEYIKTGKRPKEYYDYSAIKVKDSILSLNVEHDPKYFNIKDWNGDIINPNTGHPYNVRIDHKVGVIVAKHIEPWGEVKQFKQRFGYFESRCKMPKSEGTWPAFWLSGSMCWPPEIDIFEVYTSKSFSVFESNYHWGIDTNDKYECFNHKSDVKLHESFNLSDDFHTYACEWDSSFIKWYFDNRLVRVAHRNVTNVFEPLILILNNAIDDKNCPNYKNIMNLPTSFQVDYVRVYKKK